MNFFDHILRHFHSQSTRKSPNFLFMSHNKAIKQKDNRCLVSSDIIFQIRDSSTCAYFVCMIWNLWQWHFSNSTHSYENLFSLPRNSSFFLLVICTFSLLPLRRFELTLALLSAPFLKFRSRSIVKNFST